jgi:hypothetical protein
MAFFERRFGRRISPHGAKAGVRIVKLSLGKNSAKQKKSGSRAAALQGKTCGDSASLYALLAADFSPAR